MTTDELKTDIAYVRAATDRSNGPHVPSISLLWAVIGLCGFAAADFIEDERWIGRYWLVAALVGICLSLWWGFRASRRLGQADRRTGVRWGLHWLAFVVAGVLGGMLVAAGHLQASGVGPLWVLLLSLSYFQSGVHLDRRHLPVSGVLGVSFLVTLFVPVYASTLAGVLMAAALVGEALLGARTSDAAD